MTPQHPRGSFRVVLTESAPGFYPDRIPEARRKRGAVPVIVALITAGFAAIGAIASACWLAGACQ